MPGRDANCQKCVAPLTYVPQFEGLYCNHFCCGHCPDRRVTPCQKDVFEAKQAGKDPSKWGLLEQLAELQHG